MYGQNTKQGFIPAVPGIEDLMQQLGMAGNQPPAMQTELARLEDVRKQVDDGLREAYLKTFSTPQGERVLEHLLDTTLRRSFKPVSGFSSVEETALYTAERTGQNAIVIQILKMMQDAVDAGDAKKSSGKKKK